MSRFFGESQNESEDYETVTGQMSCQTCDEVVRQGKIRGNDLIWKCSKGHTSEIEGFMK